MTPVLAVIFMFRLPFASLKGPVAYSVLRLNGRIPVVLALFDVGLILLVTKPIPLPVADVSPMAQGTMGLVVAELLVPTRPKPVADVKLMLATLAAAVAPRLVPRNSTVAPGFRAMLSKITFVVPPVPAMTVIVD